MKDRKARIIREVKAKLQSEMSDLQSEIAEIKASGAEDQKSAMGDKYETSREITAASLEKLFSTYEGKTQQFQMLEKIERADPGEAVDFGSLVSTDSGCFLIGPSVGAFEFEGENIFLISPHAPMAEALLGTGKGEKITFRGKEIQILELS